MFSVTDRERPLKFFVIGEFDLDGDGRADRDGRERIEDLIREWGGNLEPRLTAQIDFVVLGGPPPAPRRSMDRDAEDDVRYQSAKKRMDKDGDAVARRVDGGPSSLTHLTRM